MYLEEIFSFVAIAIIITLVTGFFLFIIAETNQTTMPADNQQGKIISGSADTQAEEAQITNKQDTDQTKEMSNPTYVTNNYTYNSTGGDFLGDLSINIIAEIVAAFTLGFLGNKVYLKFKKKV